MSTQPAAVETTTSLALHEKGKLIKSLRRFDMVFFTVSAPSSASSATSPQRPSGGRA
jgi:hypothetical protein